MKFTNKLLFLLLIMQQLLAAANTDTSNSHNRPNVDLENNKTLYVVGYAHLDTQWRWDYQTTVDKFIKNTLDDNFAAFEKFPDYTFNFTGSRRYEMMKEYYPEKYEKMKDYIRQGRWFVSGSSVDECDVNVPSPESLIRQVLYGNQYFRKEFGVESYDFILPDCFGFPASMPSIWAHCGLEGFSTQKLTWGSAVGIPFNVGVWKGPDGNSVVTAFNPGRYDKGIDGRVDLNEQWTKRIEDNGKKYGLYADYNYLGIGDAGGAPRTPEIQNYMDSMNNADSNFQVRMVPSDQMYLDITDAQRASLPVYQGDLLLTEHSAGSLTSQSYMKRWNRKNELLADAAERSAVMADYFGANEYPSEKLYQGWHRVLSSQMHDILPGTCIPKAYDYAENDEVVALNSFAEVLKDSIAASSRVLDTNVTGTPILVYNPLSIPREDIVEAQLDNAPAEVKVFDSNNNEVPSQIVSCVDGKAKIIFSASVPALSYSVYNIETSDTGCSLTSTLKVTANTLENEYYKVTVAANGNVSSIYDKKVGREILASEHKFAFLYESPAQYPAWNMDWTDRKNPPEDYVDGPAEIKIVENGPARVALQIKRKARDSYFTQTIRLAAGDCGKRVEFNNFVDWQSQKCSLKASFPLTVSNELATYNQGLGKIQRNNNHPKKYEVPAHQWFDLTDTSGEYGVSILEDCKFGSDKPSDNELRLTLLFTPAARSGYKEQNYQEWGRHEFVYAVYGHADNWQAAASDWQARRLNQPLRGFKTNKHSGELGRQLSLLAINTDQVEITAVKKAENSDHTIVRFQELHGVDVAEVALSTLAGIAEAYEVDGQERRIAPATVVDGKLEFAMGKFGIRSFAVKFADSPVELTKVVSRPVKLAYNVDVMSRDNEKTVDAMDAAGKSIPAELIPEKLVRESIEFKLGSGLTQGNNAIACKGQTVKLPQGDFNRLYLLASAAVDTDAVFKIGTRNYPLSIQSYTGFIGQYDKRQWSREFFEIDYNCYGYCTGIGPAYIKRDNLAYFTKHRHDVAGKNESYKFVYFFKYELPLNANASTLTLPDNPDVKVFAVTAANNPNASTAPAAPLYDTFDNFGPVDVRVEYVKPNYIKDGAKPLGKVAIQRSDDDYSKLSQSIKVDDRAAAANGAIASYVRDRHFAPVHQNAGADGVKLPRLIDGKPALNNDDINNNVWLDGGEARLIVDLKKMISVKKIDTFSWHSSDRAPQAFTLWGSNEKVMPDVRFLKAKDNKWTYLASVDTFDLGQGGIHCSTVTFNKPVKYRYLLWITEERGQGTFFTELDVLGAE